MGYTTQYYLGWDGEDTKGFYNRPDEIGEYIEEHGSYEMKGARVGEWWKWYYWREDMTELSKQFPDTTFRLEGHGEEFDDVWVAFFRNGQHYREWAQVTWPEYEPERLKEA